MWAGSIRSLKESPMQRWPPADRKRCFSTGALTALCRGGDGEQATEHRSFKQPVENRAEQWLVEWADIDQQHERAKHRERRSELLPGLELLPPDHDLRRRTVRRGLAILRRGAHRPR